MNDSSNVILSTERLLLRELNPVVSGKIFETYSDAAIMEYFGMKTDAELQLEKERYWQGLTMFGRSFSYFHLIEKKSGQVIGWCGFHTWYTNHFRAELGYVLNDDDHKRKGYMKEALRHIVQFGFDKLNLYRIEALIAAENIPSFKLLDGLGFKFEGVLRGHYFTKGNHEDSHMYSLLKSEWQGS